MIPLNQIQVPEPCGEDWDAMAGDARRRFCAGCGCHVHDLSAMTARAALDLLDRTDGRVCVRFQTKPDGMVLTQDVPMPLERRALWPRRLAAAASWALALVVTSLGLTARAAPALKASHAAPKKHATAAMSRTPRVVAGKIVVPRVTPPSMPHVTMGVPLAFPPARK